MMSMNPTEKARFSVMSRNAKIDHKALGKEPMWPFSLVGITPKYLKQAGK